MLPRFQAVFVNFSQLQSVLVNFSQFNQTKTQKFFTDRKVGQNNTQVLVEGFQITWEVLQGVLDGVSSVETSLSCTAADFKKIAPG